MTSNTARIRSQPSSAPKVPRLGVLGGMGPLATTDFLRKLIEAMPAEIDQEHMPFICLNDPTIPDRGTALARGEGAVVETLLLDGLETLVGAGAGAIAIPCNTAHHWHQVLQDNCPVPILHIADAAVAALPRAAVGGRVTVIATPATLASGFYADRLVRHGFTYLEFPIALIERSIMPAIAAVKAGRASEARRLVEPAVDFVESNEGAAILACSELPIAFGDLAKADARFIDTNWALAQHCVRWWIDTKRAREAREA